MLTRKFLVRGILLVLISLALVIILIWLPDLKSSEELLFVTFLDVGQGDSIFIRTPSGRTMLIDGGGLINRPYSDSIGMRVIAPMLRRQGVNRIDVMVLTHPHDDHVQGLIPILRDFQVDMVLDPALPHGSESYRRFLSLIKKKRIVYKRAVRGQVINFGDGVRAVVLHPPGERLMSVNDYCNENSVVLRVTYGMSSLLLAGDAGIEAENDILQAGVEVESDVLKVAHHGSRFATSERWLDYVKPKVAVISVGRNNPFGHPSDEVLARLTSRRIRVFRTDCNGAIMLRITKTRIAVQPTMPSPRRSSLAKEVLVSASVVSRLAKIRPTRCL